jgi:hypothetical protein
VAVAEPADDERGRARGRGRDGDRDAPDEAVAGGAFVCGVGVGHTREETGPPSEHREALLGIG